MEYKERRLSALEYYYNRGDLEYSSSVWSGLDRLSAGQQLAGDFDDGCFEDVRAIDLAKIRVDGGGNGVLPEKVMDARKRYFDAMQNIPTEYWDVVRTAVIENRLISVAAKKGSLRHRNEMYLQKHCLRVGLDYLIEFYVGRKKNKYSRHLFMKK